MIPRTKVNYGITELLKAFFVTRKGVDHKEDLIGLLQQVLGSRHVLLTPSGRGSLYVLLKAIDRNRVLIPTYTCKAVVEAVMLAGKTIDYIEVEPGGFNMDCNALERTVDERSVVIATHQFGFPCDIERIVTLCHSRGALVIEDVAAALGTRINGRLAGTFADASFFSFDSTKLINVPMKGGFIYVKDPYLTHRVQLTCAAVARPMPVLHKARLLLQAMALVILENPHLYRFFHWLLFSSRRRFTLDSEKLNVELTEFYRYEMANWQAYIALNQVRRLPAIVQRRVELYGSYLAKLRDCRSFQLPPRDHNSEWACIRFPIRVRVNKLAFYDRAVRQGVDFAFSFTFIACPVEYAHAWGIANSVLDLPFYGKLSDRELDRVVQVLRLIDEAA